MTFTRQDSRNGLIRVAAFFGFIALLRLSDNHGWNDKYITLVGLIGVVAYTFVERLFMRTKSN
jgi:hypothetical protein